MIVDGARFQYDFKAKEKQFRATITSQDALIESLKEDLAFANGQIERQHADLLSVKDELSAVRTRFRNFRAQVKAPNRLGKEQPSNEVA